MSARSFWPPAEAAQVDYETLRGQVLELTGLPEGLAAARFARRGLAGLIAHAVFADCLAVQRHTAILRTFCEIRCISMHSPLTISGGFLPHHDGAPQAGGTCGAPGGEV